MSVRQCVKCKAKKADGSPCTRTTCDYPEFCWQHFQQEYHLKLAKSNIRGANKGLFTTKDIKPNQRIVEYTGEIKTDPDTRGVYVLEVAPNKFIDARSTQSKIGRYANHCKAINTRNKECKGNNAHFGVYRGQAWLKAKKRIPAGAEIFASYGRSYFS